jgi:hypothetical protein
MAKDERRQGAGRDAAGIGPHLREGMRLVPLKELEGFRLAEGEPDIRGWHVQTVSGRKIGEVDDLLVDERSGDVVLIDVDLDGTRKRTLAPARAVQLQRERRIVLIDSVELHDAEQLPTLARTGEVTAEEVRIFRDSYAHLYGSRGFHDDRDYDIRRRDQAVQLGPGDAAPLADRSADTIDATREGRDVRFPQGTDEVVVERRPVVMEEVVVRRRAIEPNETTPTDALDADRIRDRSVTSDLRDDERRP